MKCRWMAAAAVVLGVGGGRAWAEEGPPPPASVQTQPAEKGIVLDLPEGLAPAVQPFSGLGEVNWSSGWLIAVGEAEVQPPEGPADRNAAMRLARVRAYANALRLGAQLRRALA